MRHGEISSYFIAEIYCYDKENLPDDFKGVRYVIDDEGGLHGDEQSVADLKSKLEAAETNKRMGMVIDLDKCTGCKGCAVACKSEFKTNLGVFKSNVIELEHGRYPKTKRDFLPWLCNHCDNPVCITDCPVDPISATFEGVKYQKRATYKRPDGVVLVDQHRCVGCGQCIESCPYKARFFNPTQKAGGDKTMNPADKCTLCEHRLDKGVVPSCVNTCCGRARIVGDLNDPKSEASKLLKKNRSKTLLSRKRTKPQVSYIGKPAKGIDKVLKNGVDIRKEANSEYQLKV